MENRFMTRYTRPEPRLEAGGGERITESAGYIPPQKQIEQFILAGKRLNEARKEMFDFPDGVEDENFSDPTRSPNFDMADAAMLAKPAVKSLDAAAEEAKKLQKERYLKEKQEFSDWKKSKKSTSEVDEKKD